MTQEKVLLDGVAVDTLGEYASATLTLTGAIAAGSHAESVVTSDTTNVSDAETLTIGSTVYRFKDTMLAAYDVQIGGTAAITLDNLKAAINASGTPGTEYYAGTLAHPTVVATTNDDTTQKVIARVPGTAANTAATTTTASHLSWADTTLGGGTGTSNPGVAPETVTIDSVTYSFVDVLSETNAPAAAIVNQVLFGANSAAALDNLKLAINAGASAGTNYSTGTVAHPTVNATTNTDTAQTVEADSLGTAGNSITVSEVITNGTWGVGVTTLSSGDDSTAVNNILSVEGYDFIGVQFKAASITSGNGVFILKGTINGIDWVTLPMITVAANTNGQTLIRVVSVTLSSNTTNLVWLDRHMALKAIRAEVDVTTDGTYSAHAIATACD